MFAFVLVFVLYAIDKTKKLSTSYSSNILTFNVFEYWRQKNDFSKITKALDLEKFEKSIMHFEKTFEIKKNKNIDPHLDIYLQNDFEIGAGIECKYTESFNRNYSIIKWDGFSDYLNDYNIWEGLENLRIYADKLYSEKKQNIFFNVKQSICHILALHKHFRNDTNRYYFIYLYYPSLFKIENRKYIDELEEFAYILRLDRIKFIHKTYYQLIQYLKENIDIVDNDYIKYNNNRYFLLKDYFIKLNV